ncbi:hypothetical protein GCM10010193_56660 [Kitasatospora atroaurantiaca]|uniref:Uncharacterized protein n=1 Tax=Kitasatospora atroaurantiaca TaxID=285545 RepID=A0A561EMT2_9ACTN|nr:hypothetical protein [Kitasatospora atroaurantiaca]TWE16917.1 hypothetical protein FB465_1912 [Kitasatospora atroaurantiaca]
MKEEIIARARFLLTELHLPPVEAGVRLKDYFPDLELEERVRYVQEATEYQGQNT